MLQPAITQKSREKLWNQNDLNEDALLQDSLY